MELLSSVSMLHHGVITGGCGCGADPPGQLWEQFDGLRMRDLYSYGRAGGSAGGFLLDQLQLILHQRIQQLQPPAPSGEEEAGGH